MESSDQTLCIDPDLGAPMTVRLTSEDSRFRPGNAVSCDDDLPLVEFYDRRYASEAGFTRYGEFIRCYCASALLDVADAALLLNVLVPHWSVDKTTMARVRAWLREAISLPQVS